MGICNCVFTFLNKYNFFPLLIFFSTFTVLSTLFFGVKSRTKTLNEPATVFYNMQQCICYIAYTLSPIDVWWSAVAAFPHAIRQGHAGVKASVSIRFFFSPPSFHLSLSYIPSVFLWLFCERIPREPYRIITSIYNVRPFSSSFWHILLASTMGVCVCVCLLIILRK